jgi:hypothetical protein
MMNDILHLGSESYCDLPHSPLLIVEFVDGVCLHPYCPVEMETHRLVRPLVLARRIRMVMGDQKVTRKALAQASGISRPSLAHKLDGRVPFTYNELVRIIESLGVVWQDLLADQPEEEPEPESTRIRLRDFKPRMDRRL